MYHHRVSPEHTCPAVRLVATCGKPIYAFTSMRVGVQQAKDLAKAVHYAAPTDSEDILCAVELSKLLL